MNYRRWLDRAGFLGTAGSVLVSSGIQGLGVLSLRVEIAFVVLVVVLIEAVLSSLIFTVFVGLSGFLFGLQLVLDTRSTRPRVDGDQVTAIVPVYRDANTLNRSIDSLLATEYNDLDIRIVCEPDDFESQKRAASYTDHDNVDVLINSDQPGTKAAAINRVVNATESEYLAVFDADEEINPQFIGHGVALLETHDIVQGRTVPEPTGAIEELAYYESVLLSYAARRFLYLFTDFRMASSRAVMMHRDVFERLGGYDPDMLTEDFDFAYRSYQEHLAVKETLRYPSRIEAAHSLRDWWGQRKRWMTGYVQVFHRLLGEIQFTDYRSWVNPIICASTVVGSALMLSLLSKFMVLFLVGAEAWFLPPVAIVFAVTLVVRFYDVRTSGLNRPTIFWVLTPVLLPVYGFATIKAVFEYMFTWDGEWYAVEKD